MVALVCLEGQKSPADDCARPSTSARVPPPAIEAPPSSSASSQSARDFYFSTYSMSATSDARESFVASCARRPRWGKIERLQRELLIMCHVQRCEIERVSCERSSRRRRRRSLRLQPSHQDRSEVACSVPLCTVVKRTLLHCAMCEARGCGFSRCNVTRTIIRHWLQCLNVQCSVCMPVRDSLRKSQPSPPPPPLPSPPPTTTSRKADCRF